MHIATRRTLQVLNESLARSTKTNYAFDLKNGRALAEHFFNRRFITPLGPMFIGELGEKSEDLMLGVTNSEGAELLVSGC